MNDIRVGVSASGVVMLGQDITCDGFHRDYKARVQTHVHLDHMHSFETSKGLQDVYLSEPTLELLIAEFNADLSARVNVNMIPVAYDEVKYVGSSKLSLLQSNHMLGSVQVAVELSDGIRVGYSGDFQWPLERAINVDQLVIDSTYGSPESVRRYSQEEAEEQLLRIATEKLRCGPIHVKAHRGTLHRGIQVLSSIEGCPIVASNRLCSEIKVYQQFGYPIGPVFSIKSAEGIDALKSGRFIRCYGMGDQFPLQLKLGTSITLSAFMCDPENPVLEYSERALRVALTDHADFDGVMQYVEATGAKFVLTDNTRGGHAIALAQAITAKLGIPALPSESEASHEWGT